MDFKVYRDQDARSDLIRHYAYLASVTAGRLVPNPTGGLDKTDVASAGIIGLIKAVDLFDPTRDVKFETYAIALIRGAILDVIRSSDWTPRPIREKLKALEKAKTQLEAELKRAVTEREIAEKMDVSEEEVLSLWVYYDRNVVHSLDELVQSLGDSALGSLVDSSHDAQVELERNEMNNVLGEAIETLPLREKRVISLYFYEGLTFKEVGRTLEISETRAFQIFRTAMNQLRSSLATFVAA